MKALVSCLLLLSYRSLHQSKHLPVSVNFIVRMYYNTPKAPITLIFETL